MTAKDDEKVVSDEGRILGEVLDASNESQDGFPCGEFLLGETSDVSGRVEDTSQTASGESEEDSPESAILAPDVLATPNDYEGGFPCGEELKSQET